MEDNSDKLVELNNILFMILSQSGVLCILSNFIYFRSFLYNKNGRMTTVVFFAI